MSLSSHRHRALAERALDGVVVADANHRQVAEGFNVLRDRFGAQVERLFGAIATDALFERSIHLAKVEFPYLSTLNPGSARRIRVDGPQSALPAIDARVLHAGLAAVLSHDIALLSALVGEDIVMPLVNKAWPSANDLTDTSEGE
jgi:hypothetical protein